MENFFGLKNNEYVEPELEKKKKRSPFDYVKSINTKEIYLGEDLSGYSQFLVTRSFAGFTDTVFYAKEINLFPALSDRMHYDFYYYGVPKKKRYSEWFKKDNYENISMISKFYNVSFKKAEEFLEILTVDQIKQIEHSMVYGVIEK